MGDIGIVSAHHALEAACGGDGLDGILYQAAEHGLLPSGGVVAVVCAGPDRAELGVFTHADESRRIVDALRDCVEYGDCLCELASLVDTGTDGPRGPVETLAPLLDSATDEYSLLRLRREGRPVDEARRRAASAFAACADTLRERWQDDARASGVNRVLLCGPLASWDPVRALAARLFPGTPQVLDASLTFESADGSHADRLNHLCRLEEVYRHLTQPDEVVGSKVFVELLIAHAADAFWHTLADSMVDRWRDLVRAAVFRWQTGASARVGRGSFAAQLVMLPLALEYERFLTGMDNAPEARLEAFESTDFVKWNKYVEALATVGPHALGAVAYERTRAELFAMLGQVLCEAGLDGGDRADGQGEEEPASDEQLDEYCARAHEWPFWWLQSWGTFVGFGSMFWPFRRLVDDHDPFREGARRLGANKALRPYVRIPIESEYKSWNPGLGSVDINAFGRLDELVDERAIRSVEYRLHADIDTGIKDACRTRRDPQVDIYETRKGTLRDYEDAWRHIEEGSCRTIPDDELLAPRYAARHVLIRTLWEGLDACDPWQAFSAPMRRCVEELDRYLRDRLGEDVDNAG